MHQLTRLQCCKKTDSSLKALQHRPDSKINYQQGKFISILITSILNEDNEKLIFNPEIQDEHLNSII